MVWKEQDKAAALSLLVELASRLKVEEIFSVMVDIGQREPNRLELLEAPRTTGPCPGLARCIRNCLRKYKVA